MTMQLLQAVQARGLAILPAGMIHPVTRELFCQVGFPQRWHFAQKGC